MEVKQRTITSVKVYRNKEYVDIDISQYDTDDEINEMLAEKYPDELLNIEADIIEPLEEDFVDNVNIEDIA